MDKAQDFINNNLLTKCFNDPKNEIDEGRLLDTLMLLPTDGGSTSRIKKIIEKRTRLHDTKVKNKVPNSEPIDYDKYKQANYKKINKRSKQSLKDFIIKSKLSVNKAKKIAHEKNITKKADLFKYLETNDPELYKDLPKYDKFSPLFSELWISYIQELLNISYPCQSTEFKANGMQILTKLSMADYNGAALRVTKSKNHNTVGIEGIVVWDAQKNFIMITSGSLVDEIKIIPKKGTLFDFEIPLNDEQALQYSILGDRFKYRSVDRAGRKFKTRRCDDLLFYVFDS